MELGLNGQARLKGFEIRGWAWQESMQIRLFSFLVKRTSLLEKKTAKKQTPRSSSKTKKDAQYKTPLSQKVPSPQKALFHRVAQLSNKKTSNIQIPRLKKQN